MFDTIGHTHDDDANQRRAASAILLTVLFGGVMGLGLVVTAWTAQQVASPQEPAWVELQEPDNEPPAIEVELPGVPAPPPPQMALGQTPDPDVEPQVQPPDEMSPEIQPLTEPEERVANTPEPVGDPDGVAGGDPDGDINGSPFGVDGGDPFSTGTTIGSVAPTVHVRDVRIRRSVTPDYPRAAREMNLGQVDCRVRVLIDPDGKPADLTMLACPGVFHDEVRQAVERTRWYPYRIGGQKSQARFDILYRFQPPR